MSLSLDKIERYSRSILCDHFSEEAQTKLMSAGVLVVGAGGLGCAVLQYLVAAGVGRIGVVDFDSVSLSNLQRQILFSHEDIGKLKVEIVAKRLMRLNPDVVINPIAESLSESNAEQLLADYDLAVDCTDNYQARLVLDSACAKSGKAMIYGSAQNWTGQVATFNWGSAGRYVDMFGEGEQQEVVGVMPPCVGVVGSLQAVEAIKIITSSGETLDGKLMVFDYLKNQYKVYSL